MDGKQVAKWYITRGSLAVDALSTIAWVTQVGCAPSIGVGGVEGRVVVQFSTLNFLCIGACWSTRNGTLAALSTQGLLPSKSL